MSWQATRWVWEHSTAAGVEKLVALALADHADTEGANAWPSVERLAGLTGLSESTVRRALHALAGRGEIEANVRSGATTVYAFPGVAGVPGGEGCQPDRGVSLTGEGCQPDRGGVSERQGRGVSLTPELVLELSLEPVSELVVAPRPAKRARSADAEAIERLFDLWLTETDRTSGRFALTKDRRAKIAARLSEGYAEDDLADAIRGWRLDEFYSGRKTGTPWNDLTHLLKNSRNVEHLRDLHRKGGPTRPLSTIERLKAQARERAGLTDPPSRGPIIEARESA